jgi:hypothetical protein
MQADDAEQTITWGQKAFALADRLGDTDALAHALNTIGTVELGRGDMGGMEKLERSLELARSAGELRYVAMAYINLCAALSRLGRYLDMARYAEEGIEYCEEHGLEAWTKWLISAKIDIQLALGLWDQAAEGATSILEHDGGGPRRPARPGAGPSATRGPRPPLSPRSGSGDLPYGRRSPVPRSRSGCVR